MKRLVISILCAVMVVIPVHAEEIDIASPSVVVMEASTGKVIYEKNSEEKRPPASVTKVMTMLLILDEVEKGTISLEDEVTTSEHAASMGGSQVFLEPGEVQTVDTLLKCIAVASGNDACVAMAEYISGTEEEFVNKMNERAKGLGMKNTHFVNCNGLDAEGHLTTAKDIALMSRELITVHPEIENYVTIWMENITHVTRKGSSEFGLANTNKLIRQYEYATGLKTGSTDNALFCVSATARKNQIDMIAVVLGANDSKTRFQDAKKLLNYGFSKSMKYIDDGGMQEHNIPIKNGVEKEVTAVQESFSYVDTEGKDLTKIEKRVVPDDKLEAPVKTGDKVGEMIYYIDGEKIGSALLKSNRSVDKMNYKKAVENALDLLLL